MASSMLLCLLTDMVICRRTQLHQEMLHVDATLESCRSQVAMVRTLHAMGGAYREAAASVLTGLLEREPAHAGALAAYAGMAIERGMAGDAMHVLLNLLVRRPDDTDVRCSLRIVLLVRLLSLPCLGLSVGK